MIGGKMKKITFALLSLLLSFQVAAQAKEFKVCWSHYTGWEPWAYADSSGILKKWANKYGIKISHVRINDYVESINLYTAKQYQALKYLISSSALIK